MFIESNCVIYPDTYMYTTSIQPITVEIPQIFSKELFQWLSPFYVSSTRSH